MKYHKGLENGVIYGDVNEDQIVNAMDLAFLVIVVLTDQVLTEAQWTRADLNFDEVINIMDIFHLTELINNY